MNEQLIFQIFAMAQKMYNELFTFGLYKEYKNSKSILKK